MNFFGIEISRRRKQVGLSSVDNRGWWPLMVHEPYSGAWQRNDYLPLDTVLANTTVFRCITLIAGDVAKLDLRLVEEDANDIWNEVESSAFTPVLKNPNDYQNRIQFVEHWLHSKLATGNAYVLKGRDNRNVVNSLYVLDPNRVRPLVAPDGAVYYELRRDDLSGVHDDNLTVPASEIIHDRINALFNPLCGLSPIFAAGLSATNNLRIKKYSDRFFSNAARPSGLLTAPGDISQLNAERAKNFWETNFTGDNQGRIAVFGNGMKFEPMTQNAVDSEVIAQLKWTAADVCSAFGVPGYKVGVEPAPSYNNVEALSQGYYDDCLQLHITSMELLLDSGLELPKGYAARFDLDDLLRMDSATLIQSLAHAVGAGVMAPNEGRKRIGLGPVPGGDTPYLQQQYYSLEALNKRDMADPFAKPPAPQIAPPQQGPGNPPPVAPPPPKFYSSALAELRRGLSIHAVT